MDTYGLVKTTFADETYKDIEPVGDEFIGVKYYIAEEADSVIEDLRELLEQSMNQTDEMIAMYRETL